jgi:hypothetical protein
MKRFFGKNTPSDEVRRGAGGGLSYIVVGSDRSTCVALLSDAVLLPHVVLYLFVVGCRVGVAPVAVALALKGAMSPL